MESVYLLPYIRLYNHSLTCYYIRRNLNRRRGSELTRSWYWTRERLVQLMECVRKVDASTEGGSGTIVHDSGLARLVFPHYTVLDSDAHLNLIAKGLGHLAQLGILDKGRPTGGEKVRHFTLKPISDEMIEGLKQLRKS